ncbi:stage iii sporulation protein ad, putative [Heliomicrobium modesticaldum Ice1]|uniref:Stage iii sporulation protein ad, putative n=1 Tax=Heliobacterium modesticaldum (strain ATCC 51547 / Ice1) TaxID=498761 RepID=B0TEH7_HELMI|nr:stage III sporulation protein AD [Heliomicrobium modesticaldum]ABZ82896.1 stage iii sporulation protein ad, putative [Heliomicrobium modesticaldum Ice1]
MEILQVVGVGIIATIFLVIVRKQRPELAVQLSIAAGVILFLFVLSKISAVMQVLEDLANKAQINRYYLTTLLKIVGIAYIAEFGAQICRDAGESTIATKVEMAAKIVVMVLALPILLALMDSLMSLLPRGGPS